MIMPMLRVSSPAMTVKTTMSTNGCGAMSTMFMSPTTSETRSVVKSNSQPTLSSRKSIRAWKPCPMCGFMLLSSSG